MISLFFLLFSVIEYRQLAWADFKGKPKNFVAETVSQIIVKTEIRDGKYYYTVTANFIPEESYTRTNSSKILKHEQGHFDITEIYARKLRKAIESFQGGDQKGSEHVFLIYENYCSEWGKYQELYDSQTNHSLNETVQQSWDIKLSTELKR